MVEKHRGVPTNHKLIRHKSAHNWQKTDFHMNQCHFIYEWHHLVHLRFLLLQYFVESPHLETVPDDTFQQRREIWK